MLSDYLKCLALYTSMSLIVGHLCSGFLSAWLSLTGSRDRHTVPFCLNTMTKLLNYSPVSSTPSGVNIC